MENKTIMEVSTFNIKSDVNPVDFANRDAKVETNFTSLQPGFIKRQSAVDDEGNYVVVVFWSSMVAATASMNKFMGDATVGDYAQMIDSPTMKMARYSMDQSFIAKNSRFVEIMAFDVKPGIDLTQFDAINKRVETDFTNNREGFLQRLTGVDEVGRQVVAVYWASKALSDASLEPFMKAPIAQEFMQSMDQSSMSMGRYKFLNLELTNKEKVVALLNSFNTGDQTPISYINPNKYIQHNLDVGDGLEGFGAVLQNAPEGGFKAEVIRAFQDVDYVFTHSNYDFFGPKVGFDVFRFEDGKIVEHWDNLAEIAAPNPSGRTQLDGTTEVTDLAKTESNKKIVETFIDEVLLNGKMDNLTTLVNPSNYIQHNSAVADGLDGLGAALEFFAKNDMVMIYDKTHKVLAQGNFVLSMSEGKFGKAPGDHVAYYDLFRLENNQIVEHWDVIQAIPDKSDWKNSNGKF